MTNTPLQFSPAPFTNKGAHASITSEARRLRRLHQVIYSPQGFLESPFTQAAQLLEDEASFIAAQVLPEFAQDPAGMPSSPDPEDQEEIPALSGN